MPYTAGNVRKVFTAVNKVLKTLPLSNNNAIFQDWTAVRFDSTFDIQEEHTELLMLLLNRSVNLSDRKKCCRRIPIPGKTAEEAMSQSLRFGNHSFTFNVYRKVVEIENKGKAIMLDGKLKETQTANYFSDFYPVDCAVLPANACFYQKHGTLLPTGRLL